MLDVAIVGGGLCGLTLAHSLQAAGNCDWRLFEARQRLGGRAFTLQARGGAPIDMGATWFWPDTQPAMSRLVADLGLQRLAQLDDGRVLHLHDPNRAPEAVALTAEFRPAADPGVPASPGQVHGGAQRVVGGMGAVIEAIARPLPAARLRLDHQLEAIIDRGDHVELHVRHEEAVYAMYARRVVLALPPRVAAASVRFTPELDQALLSSLQGTPTWMATAAKAGFAYTRAFWHDKGLTGNAWVTHPQAMLAEVFDASGPSEGPDAYPGAALAGFAALGAADRARFTLGRDLLLESQVVQLFGQEAADPALLIGHVWQDWALEPETCTPTDIEEEGWMPGAHPSYGEPLLTEPHWHDKLFFGGSETAQHGGGYLEGALRATARLRRQLLGAMPVGTTRPAASAPNDASLQAFHQWVQGERTQAMSRYRERLHQALSHQDADQLTQKAVLGALESLYDEALTQLKQLPLQLRDMPVEQGRVALTPKVLEPFVGLTDELLAEVVLFNNTSCALSNFPVEHRPSGDYLRTIRRDLAAAWQAFALAANACLLDKTLTATPAQEVSA